MPHTRRHASGNGGEREREDRREPGTGRMGTETGTEDTGTGTGTGTGTDTDTGTDMGTDTGTDNGYGYGCRMTTWERRREGEWERERDVEERATRGGSWESGSGS